MIFRVRRSLIDGAMVICSSCNVRAATHSIDKRGKRYDECCECYIATGAAIPLTRPVVKSRFSL